MTNRPDRRMSLGSFQRFSRHLCSHSQPPPFGFTGHSRRAGTVIPPLATPHPAATTGRKSGSFACSISPWFVRSRNLPMINGMAIWLRCGAFPSPPAPSLASGRVSRPARPLRPKISQSPTVGASPGDPRSAERRGRETLAERSTPHPAGGQHATKCYVFRFFGEAWRA